MLIITIKGDELFDEITSTFTSVVDYTVELEHSLASVSKWESKYQKPFLSKTTPSADEILDYIKFMIISPNIPSDFFDRLTQENLDAINDYIQSKESATTFNDTGKAKPNNEIITSELIYYWMVSYNIPFECEHWHLNRLFSLIRLCNVKNSKPKKMSRNELAQRNQELNAQRRAQLGTKG